MSSGAIAAVLVVLSMVAHAQQQPDTYTFVDEVTGIGIELPVTWERRQPERLTQPLAPGHEGYLRRTSDSASAAGVVVVALASPYEGPSKNRPAVLCTSRQVSGTMGGADLQAHVRDAVDVTFGRLEAGATISEPAAVRLSGRQAARISIANLDDAVSAELIAVQNGPLLLQCFGVHDATFRDSVTRALASLTLRDVKVPPRRGSLKNVFMQFGCNVASFDTLMAVSERDKGLSRQDALDLRMRVTFPPRAGLYGVGEPEYREYATVLLDDVYRHPELDGDELAAYQVHRCIRVIGSLDVEPLSRLEAPLRVCRNEPEPQACRVKVLAILLR